MVYLCPPARGVGDAAPYTQPCGGCRGEHCSPVQSRNRRTIPRADMESAPTAYTKISIGPYKVGNRVYFGPGGVKRREVKKREEKRSTPAFFSFFTSRPPLWGSQGAGPLGRGSLPRNSETFFASFFGHKKGRSCGSMTLIRGTGRMVAGDESAKQIIAQSSCQRPTPHRPASPLRAASHSPSRGTLRHPAAKPGRRVCRQPNRRGCCRRNRPP